MLLKELSLIIYPIYYSMEIITIKNTVCNYVSFKNIPKICISLLKESYETSNIPLPTISIFYFLMFSRSKKK